MTIYTITCDHNKQHNVIDYFFHNILIVQYLPTWLTIYNIYLLFINPCVLWVMTLFGLPFQYFFVGAVLRNITFTKDRYDSFIELQVIKHKFLYFILNWTFFWRAVGWFITRPTCLTTNYPLFLIQSVHMTVLPFFLNIWMHPNSNE